MIKAVIFDHGGVLWVSRRKPTRDIQELLGISGEAWRQEYFKHNTLFNVTSELTFEELILSVASKFTSSPEVLEQVRNIIQEHANNFRVNDELIDIIRELRDRGYLVSILSNHSTALHDKLKAQGIPEGLFDDIVVSGDVGYQKPNPKIFEIAFERLGVIPREVIFVDDSFRSLSSATEVGYSPLHYSNIDSFKDGLMRMLGTSF